MYVMAIANHFFSAISHEQELIFKKKIDTHLNMLKMNLAVNVIVVISLIV